MTKEELLDRTKIFAHNCVKLSVNLPPSYLGNHIKGQLIRCSTSVAANYSAVCVSQSKASFISKMSIVIEEADEARFWLQFILDENLIDIPEVNELKKEAGEIVAILMASRKTARGI